MVDINRANALDLSVLPGVGPALAEAIVTDRRENGPFADLEDLERVKGISSRTVEGLRAFATCGDDEGGVEAP